MEEKTTRELIKEFFRDGAIAIPKIEAIKLYRKNYSVGLSESKIAVEKIMEEENLVTRTRTLKRVCKYGVMSTPDNETWFFVISGTFDYCKGYADALESARRDKSLCPYTRFKVVEICEENTDK